MTWDQGEEHGGHFPSRCSLVPALTLQTAGSCKSVGWCQWCDCVCACVRVGGVHHCLFLRGLHADLLGAIDTGRATPY